MLKAPTLEKQQVIEALYLILGQDYKAGGWNQERNKRFGRWSNRAFAAQDDWDDGYDDYWGEDETGYYEDDEWGNDEPYDDDIAFDDEAGYFGDEPWPESSNETASPEQLAEEFDSAYASYVQRLPAGRGSHRSTATATHWCFLFGFNDQSHLVAAERKRQGRKVKRKGQGRKE